MSRPLTNEEYRALPEVLTSTEVGRILGVSAVQVRRWALARKVPAVQIGRSWRFSKSALEAFIAAGSPVVSTDDGTGDAKHQD